MSLGIYVHIPYCLQRCSYCDFATYEQSQIMPPKQYLQLLTEEILQTKSFHAGQAVSTIYFGGGTPSLLPADDIVYLLETLAKNGFAPGPEAEITIEINPATISPSKMQAYLRAGVNRFSVGAQTFDDALLKSVRREHDAAQTRETLSLLKSFNVNYSFDILFALPGQTVEGLKKDLDEVIQFRPNHVSPYCLTVPESHPLAKGRPLEDTQLEMFELISKILTAAGYERYEISNFCLKGFESKHNSLYWNGAEYWSLGLSAHSYAHRGDWGIRYWNPSSLNDYEALILKNRGQVFKSPGANLPDANFERLEIHQALTDFCHTRLRTTAGLSESELLLKFGIKIAPLIQGSLVHLTNEGLLTRSGKDSWRLTEQGLVVSNQVFSAFTYLRGELPI
jgi:oxygen-independent coproporphyrinogen-3 oxidase